MCIYTWTDTCGRSCGIQYFNDCIIVISILQFNFCFSLGSKIGSLEPIWRFRVCKLMHCKVKYAIFKILSQIFVYPNNCSAITLTSLSKVEKNWSRVIDVMKRFCYSKVKSECRMKYKLPPKL